MSTRSNSKLEGNIHQYLLPEASKKIRNNTYEAVPSIVSGDNIVVAGVNAVEEELETFVESGGSVNFEEVEDEISNDRMTEPTDHEKLMAILGKVAETMTTMAAAQAAAQTAAQNVAQNSNNSGNFATRALYQKLEDCPIKRKNVSLESWLREVELWDECNKVDADHYGKKYQKFIESIRNSEEATEIITVANAEFVENVHFERSKADTITKMIAVIKTKLGSTAFEKSTEAWLNFVDIKQKDDETLKDFCNRFNQAETMLKNAGITVDDSALAIQLLNRTNLNNVSRENVMTKVDTENKSDIYKNMTKAIKEIKSLSIAGEKSDNNSTYFSDNRSRKYSEQELSNYRYSRSRGKEDDYPGDRKSWRSNSRNRFRSNSRNRMDKRRSRSSSKSRFSNRYSSDRSSSRGQDAKRMEDSNKYDRRNSESRTFNRRHSDKEESA